MKRFIPVPSRLAHGLSDDQIPVIAGFLKASFKFLAVMGVALGIIGASSAHAVVVNVSFSGTYNTGGTTVFGQTGAAVPYSYQITYDTSLDTNTYFFGNGVALGANTTTHEWHGYSASGITATSVTFGTATFTAANLSLRAPAAGVSADLWFDTDLSVAAPTLAWMFFDVPLVGNLQLGGSTSGGGNIFMTSTSYIDDRVGRGRGESSNLLLGSKLQPPKVPDGGSTLSLLGLALVGLIWANRRRTV